MERKRFDDILPIILRVIGGLTVVFALFFGYLSARAYDAVIPIGFSLPVFLAFVVGGVVGALFFFTLAAILDAVLRSAAAQEKLLERLERGNMPVPMPPAPKGAPVPMPPAPRTAPVPPQAAPARSDVVMTAEGWVCPKCGWHNDPSDLVCFNCSRQSESTLK